MLTRNIFIFSTMRIASLDLEKCFMTAQMKIRWTLQNFLHASTWFANFSDCPPASEDHPGVGQAHLKPVGVGDGPGPQTEPLVGRDQGGVVPEDSLHQDTARARPVTSRLTGRSELISSCLSKREFSSVSSLIRPVKLRFCSSLATLWL